MPRNQMLLAVGQTILLSAIGWTISHHLLNNAYDNVSEHHVWKEFMDAIELMGNTSASDSSSKFNITYTNGTALKPNSTADDRLDFNISESHSQFYKKSLPRELFFMAVIAPLYYYWHIWLERTFPARPRGSTAPQGEKFTMDEGESIPQEEEVIQKWIAQGKIRRASLSWWNTFVKWALNQFVGSLWIDAVECLLDDVVKVQLPRYSWSEVKWEIITVTFGSFLDIRPLASLVGFIVIPAHQRIVFEAGAQTVWSIFWTMFVGLFLPWLASTEFVGMIVGNITEKARNDSMATAPQIGHVPSLPDEL